METKNDFAIPYTIYAEPENQVAHIAIAAYKPCRYIKQYILGNQKVKVNFPDGNKERIRIYLDNNIRIVLFKDDKEIEKYKCYLYEEVEPKHYDWNNFVGSFYQTKNYILDRGKLKVDFPDGNKETIRIYSDDDTCIVLKIDTTEEFE